MGDFGLWRSVYPSTQAAKAVYRHRHRHRPDPPYLFSLCQCGRPQAPFSPHPAAAEYYGRRRKEKILFLKAFFIAEILLNLSGELKGRSLMLVWDWPIL